MSDREASTQVWRDYGDIQKARMLKQRELMAEYDNTVYRPAIKELTERCARIGHKQGKFHSNGLGASWFYCNQCGAIMDRDPPEAE